MAKVTRLNFGGKHRAPPPPPPSSDIMAELFDMSLDVVREELEAGSARMAQWFASEYLKHESSRLRTRLELKISNARELEVASREVVEAAANGLITFEECKQMQEALARHAVLSGIRSIDEMKTRLDEMEDKSKIKRMGGDAHGVTWGRLSEKTKVANTKYPAE